MTTKTPESPTSPISPTSAHLIDGRCTPGPPQLQLVTSFPLGLLLGGRTSLSLGQAATTTSLSTPATSAPSFRAHRSHKRMSSKSLNDSFPSPLEAILLQPLSNLPTPPSANSRTTIGTALTPGRAHVIDGRQSRVAMRSPTTASPVFSPMSLSPATAITSIRSPKLEHVMSLPRPLCSKANFLGPHSPMEASATPSATQSGLSSRSTSRTRSTHARSPAVSYGTASTPERFPIRKPFNTRLKRSPPPRYHVTIRPTLASTLNGPPSAPQMPSGILQEYNAAIFHLCTPLIPLISVTTGLPHPLFPCSLLQYHLLTHEQLDGLARWYHQTEPSKEESFQYPAWIPPYTTSYPPPTKEGFERSVGANDYRSSSQFAEISLTTKRRRWGRFIGLRGCESPTAEGSQVATDENAESLVEKMEREWRDAMRRAREEDTLRDKGWSGRW